VEEAVQRGVFPMATIARALRKRFAQGARDARKLPLYVLGIVDKGFASQKLLRHDEIVSRDSGAVLLDKLIKIRIAVQ
jgi:hypothetical protein